MPDEKTPTPTPIPEPEPLPQETPEEHISPEPEFIEKRWEIGEAEVSDEYGTIDRHPIPDKPEQQE